MPRTLDEFITALPKDEHGQIDARAQELIAEEMSLRSLRKAIGKTQAVMAQELKVGQDAVSKIETRGDMHISTLRDFIAAMGGKLELIARFPDRPPVQLEALGTASLRGKRSRQNRTTKPASTHSVRAPAPSDRY